MTRAPLLLLAAGLLLTGCGGDDAPQAAPTSAPAPSATSVPRVLKPACDYLDDAAVSDALGDTVEGVAKGPELCSWGELDLSVLPATGADFDEERTINASGSDTPPPPLGLGDDSYLIVGEAGGTGSAGVLVGGTKAVLALPGDLPADVQERILTQFATAVAGQL